jgi:hypothetical protein
LIGNNLQNGTGGRSRAILTLYLSIYRACPQKDDSEIRQFERWLGTRHRGRGTLKFEEFDSSGALSAVGAYISSVVS